MLLLMQLNLRAVEADANSGAYLDAAPRRRRAPLPVEDDDALLLLIL